MCRPAHEKVGGMSGRAPKLKGNRGERAFVNFLHERGIAAERVPLSGSMGGSFSGDVRVWTVFSDWLFEGKLRKNGFKQLYHWLSPDNIDALFLKADGKEFLVVMTAEKFAKLVAEGEQS